MGGGIREGKRGMGIFHQLVGDVGTEIYVGSWNRSHGLDLSGSSVRYLILWELQRGLVLFNSPAI